MTTPTTTLAPYVTLLGFARYVGRTGPSRASFVQGLRRQRASHSGFNPHSSLLKALKADIQFRSGGSHLEQVRTAVKPRWRPLHDILVPATKDYLASLGDLNECQLVRTRDVIAFVSNLPVKINPQFGLRYADGRAEAVRLVFDEQPPPQEAILATLHLMQRHMDDILPGAEAVVVDVRRGQVHRPDPGTKPEQVEQWLAGEAAAFATMWDVA
ncbi:hypothetical protein Pme01_56300 [Planosporangium mesophilum]|uniref:Uncharacterized protein n=1 Tax=Planosporangium mesophilum TaxID=689768 RepID=A0A8J3TFM6_9ACTN|nr:hypothetical protein Pme01_56300 [Planosporangium mesophilum]